MSFTSNSTGCPFLRYDVLLSPLWCTNRSSFWSSTLMNPYPLKSSHVFTVPFIVFTSRVEKCVIPCPGWGLTSGVTYISPCFLGWVLWWGFICGAVVWGCSLLS